MNADVEQVLADLASPDEAVVLKALHQACPCAGSDEIFANYSTVLRTLEKDPRPNVRAAAKHIQRDAMDALRQQDERAAGFERNRSGGHGRRGPRRTELREGWR